MRQSTLDYLRKRYLELETEIANALLHNHDVTLTDLKYRKSIIVDEINYHQQLVRRLSKFAGGAR
jgi:hypothetical protein